MWCARSRIGARATTASFLPFLTVAGAARAGTFGTVRTVNGVEAPTIAVPAGPTCGRLLNADVTRICEIGVEGARCARHRHRRQSVAAVRSWKAGGWVRRCASILRCARRASGAIRVVDYFSAEPVTLVTLKSAGGSRSAATRSPCRALKPHGLPEPDLARATHHDMTSERERHRQRLSQSAAYRAGRRHAASTFWIRCA